MDSFIHQKCLLENCLENLRQKGLGFSIRNFFTELLIINYNLNGQF